MRKRTFFVGVISGLIISQAWRPITKASIKLGIRAGHKARELSQQALEDLGDLTAEAAEELRAEGAKGPYRRDPDVAFEQDQEIN